MGSRGSFVSVKMDNFTFREGACIYKSVGSIGGIKVLIQTKGSVKAPEYSHSANRIYAIVQKGAIKHLVYYDAHHKQCACIDFGHSHGGMRPHKHLYLDHKSPGANLNAKDKKNIAKLKKEVFTKVRTNEYNSLKEFCEEYDGNDYKSHQSFIGIEFVYDGNYYRMCREPLSEADLPDLPNGRKGHYRVVIVHWKDGWFSDFSYELIGWYADINDLLQNCQIGECSFATVIMDDATEIICKD